MMSGRLYVAEVKAVLFGGSEMWVVTPQLYKTLAVFYHLVVRRMADMSPKC